MNARTIRKHLRSLANPATAEHAQRFFKTGPGEYGEGDRFLGIRVPVLRAQVKQYEETPLHEVQGLLRSRFHEERLFALLLLIWQFKKGDTAERASIFRAYLDSTEYINSWDLVDSSAHHIVGGHVASGSKQVLYELAESDVLWERRIAIIATLHFIRNNEFNHTLRLAKQLRDDEEDLIHKAVGWMLREVGKRDVATLKRFLKSHCTRMPRTMLRYAIERLPKSERKRYLEGTV